MPKPLYGAIGGRLTTRAQIRAMSAVEMVSFSISSSDDVVEDVPVFDQDLPRLVVRQLDQARTSPSISAATESE